MKGHLDDLQTLDSRQFVIAIKRLANSVCYGNDRSRFLGPGIEYAQSRPYQFGDSVRSIDWRVTARCGKVFVKEYEAPRRLPCYLLVDTSASMTISSHHRSKYATAVHIAGGIAFACLDRASPVGMVGVGGQDLHVEPSLSKTTIMQWLHRLRTFRYDETTARSSRLAQLVTQLKENALVIVMSDLHDTRAMQAIKQMVQLHDVAVIQFRDPAEDGVRGAGFIRAQEAETGREFVTRGSGSWLNQERVEHELSRAGVDHLRLDTDRPFVHRLRRFFESRDLLGRGAR
ncbi:MAG: DUF58 domain-containing protein [Bythopirellula sp.]